MSDKVTLCNCKEGECDTEPENRLVHVRDKCIHIDGTSHKISVK